MSAKKRSTDKCGPDITSWFVEEINLHIKHFIDYRTFLSGKNLRGLYKIVIFGRYAKRLAYKYLRFKAGDCPGKNCADTVTLCGSCIHVSELGNIMFGAIGKIWLGAEPLLIAAGIKAGKGGSTGGIDSVPDMASAVAGLQIGRAVRAQGLKQIDQALLLKELTVTDTKLLDQLKERFIGDAHKWLSGIGNAPIDAFSVGKCNVCAQPLPVKAPHSDFSWIRNSTNLCRAKKEWWELYRGMDKQGIDNSKIPWDK